MPADAMHANPTGARITFPPAAIQVDAEVFVDTIADLRAIEGMLVDFNGGEESPASEMLVRRIDELLRVLRDRTREDWSRDPFAVEAFARAMELRAQHHEARGLGAEGLREDAFRIRAYQHIWASDMAEDELLTLAEASDAS